MDKLTQRLKKLIPQHKRLYAQLKAQMDTLRSRGIYNRFYRAWYSRASAAKGAHEEYIFSYLFDQYGDVESAAFIENATDAIRNCNAYILTVRSFYNDSPLQIYLDIEQTAQQLKGVFTSGLNLAR